MSKIKYCLFQYGTDVGVDTMTNSRQKCECPDCESEDDLHDLFESEHDFKATESELMLPLNSSRERHRFMVAKLLIYGFVSCLLSMIIIVVGLSIIALNSDSPETLKMLTETIIPSLKEVVAITSALFGAPLGFLLGFYFKNNE